MQLMAWQRIVMRPKQVMHAGYNAPKRLMYGLVLHAAPPSLAPFPYVFFHTRVSP